MDDPFDPTGVFAATAPSVTVERPLGRTYITKTGKIATVPGKTKGTLDHRTKKTLKLIAEHGLDAKEAYSLVNGRAPGKGALTGINAKVAEYSLQTEEMRRLSSRVVENALKGKPLKTTRQVIDKTTGRPVMREDDPTQPLEIIEKQYPSHTNMLAAASMVQDRVDPIVRQNINLNGNLADYLPFELDKYK